MKRRTLATAASAVGVLLIARFRSRGRPSRGRTQTVRRATVALLQVPETGEPLEVAAPGDGLVGTSSGRRVPMRDGIPELVVSGDVVGTNRLWQRRYDRWAPFYDLATRLYARLRSGGDEARVREYLAALTIASADRVLEVSVGTGRNLQYLPAYATYVGLDISAGMLRQCRRNLARWGREADLVLGAAEHLPFRDGAFDVVFHVGGINFFADPAGAVREMVRVARPGAQILVVDETERVARAYRRLPGHAAAAIRGPSIQPLTLVPPGALDVRLREVAGGELYCLTFRTPPGTG